MVSKRHSNLLDTLGLDHIDLLRLGQTLLELVYIRDVIEWLIYWSLYHCRSHLGELSCWVLKGSWECLWVDCHRWRVKELPALIFVSTDYGNLSGGPWEMRWVLETYRLLGVALEHLSYFNSYLLYHEYNNLKDCSMFSLKANIIS